MTEGKVMIEEIKAYAKTLSDEDLLEFYRQIKGEINLSSVQDRLKAKADKKKKVLERKAEFLLRIGMSGARVKELTGAGPAVIKRANREISSKEWAIQDGIRKRKQREQKQQQEAANKKLMEAMNKAKFGLMSRHTLPDGMGTATKRLVLMDGVRRIRYDTRMSDGDWLTIAVPAEDSIVEGDDWFLGLLANDKRAAHA